MTYNILVIGHSGSSLFSSSDAAGQYGRPFIATKTSPGGHFVCLGCSFGRLPAPGLPLPFTSAKASGAATDARAQGGLHGQPAPPIDRGSSGPLPSAAEADQPRGRRGAAAVVGRSCSP